MTNNSETYPQVLVLNFLKMFDESFCHSCLNYIFSKFEQFRTNGKIKSDVKIKNGY